GAGTTFDRTNPFTNVGRTASPKWLRSKNFESIFASLKFEPTSNFRATYKFDMSDGTSTPEVRTVTAINPNDFVGGMLLAVLAAQPAGGGRFGQVTLNPGDRRPDAFNNAWTQEAFLKAQGHNLTMEWDATDDISIKNIFSYRKASVFGPTTIVGLSGLELTPGAVLPYAQFAAIGFLAGQGVNVADPANAALVGGTIGAFAGVFGQQVGSFFAGYEGNSYGRSKQWSNELQLNYSNDWLNLTVGAMYFHSYETSSGLPGFRSNFAFGPVPELLPLGNVQDSISTLDSLAAYVQAEFQLTPKLSLIAGGRITQDKKVGSLETGGVLTGDRMTGTITGTNIFPWRFKKTKPTFSLGLNYKPNDDVLLYGKFSTAFLSGGAVGALTFAPETVMAAEAGIKSEWLDRRLRLNFTAWWAEYKHSQAAQSGTTVGFPELSVVVIDNGPLKTWGLEFEMVARPTDGLTISGNLGYTNHKLTAPFQFFIQAQQNYKHGGIPAWVGNINAQYVTQPLFGDATMLFRIDANYQGKFRAISDANIGVAGTPTNIPAFAPYEFTPPRWILNGRIALRDVEIGGASAEIGLWGKNLTNVRKPMFPFPFGNILYTNSYQEARTWGVDVIVKFGSHK
ncbi:MAG: TonB-dependent receptor, partial [Novosphingobium sp.]|nr:TonB-dependent receptor [Novosphingobium sp.]